MVKTSSPWWEWGASPGRGQLSGASHAHQSWGGEPLRGVRLCPLLCTAPPLRSLSLPSAVPATVPGTSPGGSSWVSRAGRRPQAFLQWLQTALGTALCPQAIHHLILSLAITSPRAPSRLHRGRAKPLVSASGEAFGRVTRRAAVPTRGLSLHKEHKAYPSSLLRLSGTVAKGSRELPGTKSSDHSE